MFDELDNGNNNKNVNENLVPDDEIIRVSPYKDHNITEVVIEDARGFLIMI